MMNAAMECWIETITDMDIVDEAGSLMSYMTSPEWIRVVEYGTKQEFIDALGDAVDPLSYKIMNAYGPDIIAVMPSEMHQWIKDTTILWVKNKGAGNTVTEEDIINDTNTLSNRNSIAEIKTFYDEKIIKLTQQIVELNEQNQKYMNEIQRLEQRNDKFDIQVNELKDENENMAQQIIEVHRAKNEQSQAHED